MDFAPSERGLLWRERLSDFIDKTISLHPEASYAQEQFDIVLL